MCGGECAICALGGGGCLTAMYEDNYCPASRIQVEKRLKNGEYPRFKKLMEDYIADKPIEPINEISYCCTDTR